MRKGFVICILGVALLEIGCRGSHPETTTPESKGSALNGNPIVTGNILHQVPPIYPPVAKAAGIEGTVVLHAIIAEDGSVESLDAIDGPEVLRGAAVSAVRQWVYAPYTLNGIPRRVDTTVKVNFRLSHDSK